MSAIRWGLLTCVALSIAITGIEILHYRPLLRMPGGLALVLETTAMLLAYQVLIAWSFGSTGSGTSVGLVAAAIQIGHLAFENFIHIGGHWEGTAAVTFMLATFLIWGVAGYYGAQSARALGPGIAAGAWSAIVTMAIVVLFGYVLEFYVIPPKPEYVATWEEFKRSGWTDVHAFTIADTLESALSHLIIGPIVGAVLGLIGGVVSRMRYLDESPHRSQ